MRSVCLHLFYYRAAAVEAHGEGLGVVVVLAVHPGAQPVCRRRRRLWWLCIGGGVSQSVVVVVVCGGCTWEEEAGQVVVCIGLCVGWGWCVICVCVMWVSMGRDRRSAAVQPACCAVGGGAWFVCDVGVYGVG